MLNNPYLALTFSANLSVFMFLGLSATFWLSLLTFILLSIKTVSTFKITKNDFFIFICCILFGPILTTLVNDFSFPRFFLFTLLLSFIYFFKVLEYKKFQNLVSIYFNISLILLTSSFLIFLVSKTGLITLERFISYGGRFAGFSFENVDHVFITTFLILYLLQKDTANTRSFYERTILAFLFMLLIISQSNMFYVLVFSIAQVFLIRWFRLKHQSSLFIVVSSFIILFAFDYIWQYLPSVRGNAFDILERIRGAQFLLESALNNFNLFSFEFFLNNRSCLMGSGTNNFGFLNLTCDFGIFGLLLFLIVLFFVERNLSASTNQKFYLSLIVMFSINTILLVPNYYTPSYIFALLFGIKSLQKSR